MEETNNTSAYSDIFKHIEEIRNAKEQGKLVIFVGAGVSANSGLPSWKELVKAFAEKLCYTNRKDHFCSDEFLKIPQYLYNSNRDEYLKLLKAFFGADATNDKIPNPIHDLIFKFSPAHIITTNYDPLIEKCGTPNRDYSEVDSNDETTANDNTHTGYNESSNRQYYAVVSSDKELLEKGKSAKRFIIKMHGDYKDLENIVLKEDDYLRYEQKRALISTYIKSLLVNHTFLFIGYQINDYNFKQIIDWIEYLSEHNKAVRNKLPTHYVIRTGDSGIQEYDKRYLEQKRIELLNPNDLPESYIEQSNATNLFANSHAKQLFAAMNAVIDPVADISILGSTETLLKRLRAFDDFKYIPFPSLIRILDLMKAIDLENVHHRDVILESNHDDESEKDIILGWNQLQFTQKGEDSFSLLKRACETKPEIQSYFLNAYIYGMYMPKDGVGLQRDYYKFATSESKEGAENKTVDETYELFALYLNNEYSTLLERANNSACQRTKAYYNSLYSLKARNDDIAETLESLAYSMEQQSALMRLLDKMNWFLFSCNHIRRYNAPNEFKQARHALIEYFESISESEKSAYAYIYDWIINSKSSQTILQCVMQLEKQEAFYSNLGSPKSNPYDEVSKIAEKALCFYNFIKLNLVMIDDFSDTTQLFWVYARAVLITYKPQDKASEMATLITAAETTPVRIDEFTLDIIVKYSQYKLLREYIVNHRLSEFRFSSNNNAVEKFVNLCTSKELLAFRDFDEYFKNFCILLRHCELSEEDEVQILKAIGNFESDFLKPRFEDALSNGRQIEFINELLLLLANFKHKQAYVCETICGYIALVQDDKKATMAKFLVDNVYYNSFQLLKDKILGLVAESEGSFAPYDKLLLMVNEFFKISENDINNIKSEVINISQKQSNGLQMYPDYDKAYIELCLVLILLGKIEDISFLEAAREKYPFLNCVLQPESFDIATINFKNSLWREFFENAEYKEKLLSVNDNKEKIKESLVRTLNNGNAGHAENQIFFRHFWR